MGPRWCAALLQTLPPDHLSTLLESGRKAHATLVAQVAKEDESAYKTLLARGVKEFDPYGTPAQKKAWLDLYAEVINCRERLPLRARWSTRA